MAEEGEELAAALESSGDGERHDLLTEQFDALEKASSEAGPAKSTADAPSPRSDGRDERGKFAAKAGDAPATAPPQTAPAPEPVWKRPPKSWKPETHELWNTADPRLQEYAYSREEQMRNGVDSIVGKAKFADSMQAAIEPFMGTIRGLGITPDKAVSALMQADHILRTADPKSKLDYFKKLASQYGISLDGVRQDPQSQVDPRLFALSQELNQVRGEVLSFKEQQEQAQNQALLSEIEIFAADPKNTHFEAARPTMVDLLQRGLADTLEDAYRKALRLDDNLFSTVYPQQGAPVVDRKVAADRAAKSARSAAVSVKGSTPGSSSTTTKAQDRRSMLEEQFSNLSERL